MNKYLKTLGFSLTVSMGMCISTAFAQECTPMYEFDTVNSGEITVALTNTPPYSLEKDGDIAGIDGYIVKKFADDNCLKVNYSIYTYPGAVSAVQSSRADLALGGFYRTAARAKVTELSTPVYLDQLSITSKDGIDNIDDLMGKRVGTVEGYLWVQDMEKLFDGSKTYPNSLNLAQDLHAGRIDAALDGFGASVVQNEGKDYQIKVMKSDPRIKATEIPSQTSFLLDKKNKSFIKAMNDSIEKYRADGVIDQALSEYKVDTSASKVGESNVID